MMTSLFCTEVHSCEDKLRKWRFRKIWLNSCKLFLLERSIVRDLSEKDESKEVFIHISLIL